MKKFLVLATLIIGFIGCSKNNENGDESESGTSNSLNPPAWIQGTWVVEGGTASTLEFTKNDFCLSPQGVVRQCYRSIATAPGGRVSQTVSDTEYTLSVGGAGVFIDFSFEKISARKILWKDASGDIVLVKK